MDNEWNFATCWRLFENLWPEKFINELPSRMRKHGPQLLRY